MHHGVEDLTRLLRGHRRIEVREWLAVDLLLEDRKVGAQLARVERRASPDGQEVIVPGSPPLTEPVTTL
jgi:hypothetical protein